MTPGERASRFLQAITSPVTGFPHRFNVWLAEVNTTSLRILATIIAIEGTAIRYWLSTPVNVWEPSVEWLGFLAAMAGIDTAQFFAKRKTHKQFADDPPATSEPQA